MNASPWLLLWGGAELGEKEIPGRPRLLWKPEEASHILPFNKYKGSALFSKGHALCCAPPQPQTQNTVQPARGAPQVATAPGWGTLTDPSCLPNTAVPKGSDFLDPEQERSDFS